jgi:hypothetical protein
VYAVDPLLALLQRYQEELIAFNEPVSADGSLERDWDKLARETWSATQDEIIRLKLPATTAAGAILALDHVLQSDDLFAERSESTDLQVLWQLIKAARDYIASTASSASDRPAAF